MVSRLQELLRQRAILQEHLQWLDEEINAFTESLSDDPASATEIPVPSGEIAHPGRLRPGEDFPSVEPADRILFEYQEDPKNLRVHIWRGCLLYFGLALALGMGVILLIHFGYSRRR